MTEGFNRYGWRITMFCAIKAERTGDGYRILRAARIRAGRLLLVYFDNIAIGNFQLVGVT